MEVLTTQEVVKDMMSGNYTFSGDMSLDKIKSFYESGNVYVITLNNAWSETVNLESMSGEIHLDIRGVSNEYTNYYFAGGDRQKVFLKLIDRFNNTSSVIQFKRDIPVTLTMDEFETKLNLQNPYCIA